MTASGRLPESSPGKEQVEVERLRAALRRIRDESPHVDNPGGVCPSCMAEVALKGAT